MQQDKIPHIKLNNGCLADYLPHPKKCTCGLKLTKPIYDYPWKHEQNAPVQEEVWHIVCNCGLRHIWSSSQKYNGVWKVRSINPLFDTQEITLKYLEGIKYYA